MHVNTGRYTDLDPALSEEAALRQAALELQVPRDEVVLVRGELRSVQILGERAALGSAEQERRRNRRRQQRQSRRRNRS